MRTTLTVNDVPCSCGVELQGAAKNVVVITKPDSKCPLHGSPKWTDFWKERANDMKKRTLKKTIDVTKHGVRRRRTRSSGQRSPDYVAFRANVASRENQYEHIHVEAGAFVQPGESAEQVLRDMQEFVAEKLTEGRDGEEKEVRTVKRTGTFHDRLR